MGCQGILSIIHDDVKFVEMDRIERFEFTARNHQFTLRKDDLEYHVGLFRGLLPDNYIVCIALEDPFMTLSIIPIEGEFSMATSKLQEMESTFTGLYPVQQCTVVMKTNVKDIS